MENDTHDGGRRLQFRADAPDFRPSFALAARLADDVQPVHTLPRTTPDGQMLDSVSIRASVEPRTSVVDEQAPTLPPSRSSPAAAPRPLFAGLSLARVTKKGLVRTDALQLAKKIAQAKQASATASSTAPPTTSPTGTPCQPQEGGAGGGAGAGVPYYLYGHEGGGGQGQGSLQPVERRVPESSYPAPLSSPVSSGSKRNALHTACMGGVPGLGQLEEWYRTRPGHEWLGALDGKDEAGERPIHYAVRGGHISVLDFLLATGADAGCRAGGGAGGVTPLHVGVACGDATAVHALLCARADPSARMRGGYTPLHLALLPLVRAGGWAQGLQGQGEEGRHREGCMQCVEGLIEAGSDVNAVTDGSVSPLLLASLLCEQVYAGEGGALVHALVCRGAGLVPRLAHPPLAEVPPGGTPLMMKPALYAGLELAGSKQSSGARRGPFRPAGTGAGGGGGGGDGWEGHRGSHGHALSPLHLAASMGLYEALQTMLEAGRDSSLPLPSSLSDRVGVDGMAGREGEGEGGTGPPPWQYRPGEGWVRTGQARRPLTATPYCSLTHALCTTPGQESGPSWGASESILHATCRTILGLGEWGGVAEVEGLDYGQLRGPQAVYRAVGSWLTVVETICQAAAAHGCGPSVCNSLNSLGQSPLYLLLGPPALPAPPQVQGVNRRELLAAVQEMRGSAMKVRVGQLESSTEAPLAHARAPARLPPSTPTATATGAAVPLTRLVQDARLVLLRMLLTAGADVHRPAWKGNSASTVASAAAGTLPPSVLPLTPLGLALTHGRTECLLPLLEAGAIPQEQVFTLCGGRLQGEGSEVRVCRPEDGPLPTLSTLYTPGPDCPPWHSSAPLQEAAALAESMPGNAGHGLLALSVLQSVSFDGRLPLYGSSDLGQSQGGGRAMQGQHVGQGLGRSTTLGMGQGRGGQGQCMDAGMLHEVVRQAVAAREAHMQPWSTTTLHQSSMTPCPLAPTPHTAPCPLAPTPHTDTDTGTGAGAGEAGSDCGRSWALLKAQVDSSEGWAGSALAESVAVQVMEGEAACGPYVLHVSGPPPLPAYRASAMACEPSCIRACDRREEDTGAGRWRVDADVLSARCPYLAALLQGELGAQGPGRACYTLHAPTRAAAACLLSYLCSGDWEGGHGEEDRVGEYGLEVWHAVCGQMEDGEQGDHSILALELPLPLHALLLLDIAYLACTWCLPHAAWLAQGRLLQVLKAWPECAQAMLHAAEGLQARVGESADHVWVYTPLLSASREGVQEGGTREPARWHMARGQGTEGELTADETPALPTAAPLLTPAPVDPSIDCLSHCVTAGPEARLLQAGCEVSAQGQGLDVLRSIGSEGRERLCASYLPAAHELLSSLLDPTCMHPPYTLGCLPMQLAALCVLADVADIVPEQPEKALRTLARQVASACSTLPGPALALMGLPYTEGEIAKAQYAPPLLDLLPALSLLHLARLFQYPAGSEAKVAALHGTATRPTAGSGESCDHPHPLLSRAYMPCGMPSCLACNNSYSSAEAREKVQSVLRACAVHMRAGVHLRQSLCQGSESVAGCSSGRGTGLPAGAMLWADLWQAVGRPWRGASVQLTLQAGPGLSTSITLPVHAAVMHCSSLGQAGYTVLWPYHALAALPGSLPQLPIPDAMMEGAWTAACHTWHSMLYHQLPTLCPIPRSTESGGDQADSLLPSSLLPALLLYRLLTVAPVGAWGERVALSVAAHVRQMVGWAARSSTSSTSLPHLLPTLLALKVVLGVEGQVQGEGQRLLQESIALCALRSFCTGMNSRGDAVQPAAGLGSQVSPWATLATSQDEGQQADTGRRQVLSSEHAAILACLVE